MSPSIQTSVPAVLSLSWLKLGPTRWSRKSSPFPPGSKMATVLPASRPCPVPGGEGGSQCPHLGKHPRGLHSSLVLAGAGTRALGRQPSQTTWLSARRVLPEQTEDVLARRRVNELWALVGREVPICEGRDALPGHPTNSVEQASRTWRTDDTCWWEAHPASEALMPASQAVRRREPP